jgi:hypothetical protein
LLQERTAKQVVQAFDWLESICDDKFSQIFGLLLADRGSEFDDYLGIEGSDKDEDKERRFTTLIRVAPVKREHARKIM